MSLWHETNGTGYPLVLIHGWGMNSAVWEPLLEKLTRSYEVTCVDLPGHGHSAEAYDDSASLGDWAQAVADVVPANAGWLGWSLGGKVALKAAVDNLLPVDRLFMMASTPSFQRRKNWSCAMKAEVLEQFSQNLKEDIDGTLGRFLGLQIKGSDHSRELLRSLKKGFAKRPSASEAALHAGLGFLQSVDLRDKLQTLQCPTFWMHGDKDTLSPACAVSQIDELMQASGVSVITRVIKGAAHVPFLSHPDETFQAIEDWLKQ